MKTLPPPSFKQRMSRGVRAIAVRTRLCKPQHAGNTASILTYHSLVDGPRHRFVDPARRTAPEVFDRHCAWLARHRKVVSLSALVQCLRAGGQPEPGSVVITFDGGYLDNLQTAAPILGRYGLPATLFVATDSIESAAPYWGDRLYAAFCRRRRNKLELRGKAFDLTNRKQELLAYRVLASMLTVSHADVREQHLDEIESRLGAAVRLPRLTLDWNEVGSLLERSPGWGVGILGASALDLSSHDGDAICDDIARAINAFDRHMGHAPNYFAFPFGRSSEAARGVVIEMGLQAAVAGSPDPVVRKDSDLFGLARVDTGRPLAELAFWTAGGWSGLPVRRRQVA
jgi:peptidoglycan/xylan/chitin deacetylase (PgdA/CDA1 family)